MSIQDTSVSLYARRTASVLRGEQSDGKHIEVIFARVELGKECGYIM